MNLVYIFGVYLQPEAIRVTTATSSHPDLARKKNVRCQTFFLFAPFKQQELRGTGLFSIFNITRGFYFPSKR